MQNGFIFSKDTGNKYILRPLWYDYSLSQSRDQINH
jgi:hypothetical protein